MTILNKQISFSDLICFWLLILNDRSNGEICENRINAGYGERQFETTTCYFFEAMRKFGYFFIESGEVTLSML